MVNYCVEDDTVEMRHYALRVVASGLSKSSKKLLQAEKSTTKGIPDLSRYKDISDYFLKLVTSFSQTNNNVQSRPTERQRVRRRAGGGRVDARYP